MRYGTHYKPTPIPDGLLLILCLGAMFYGGEYAGHQPGGR